MHASGEEGGLGTSNPKSSGEEEPAEETGKETPAGGTEAERWLPGGLQGGSDDCPAENWPGTCISEVTWRKAALGWGWLIAGRSAEGGRVGEGLGFGCDEEGRSGLGPGGWRGRVFGGFACGLRADGSESVKKGEVYTMGEGTCVPPPRLGALVCG